MTDPIELARKCGATVSARNSGGFHMESSETVYCLNVDQLRAFVEAVRGEDKRDADHACFRAAVLPEVLERVRRALKSARLWHSRALHDGMLVPEIDGALAALRAIEEQQP